MHTAPNNTTFLLLLFFLFGKETTKSETNVIWEGTTRNEDSRTTCQKAELQTTEQREWVSASVLCRTPHDLKCTMSSRQKLTRH